jgi:hypothetical protein
MPSIISVLDKTFETTTENIAIDTSSTVDNALSVLKTNFFRLNHNINFAKKYLVEHTKESDFVGIGENLVILAENQLDPPSNNILQTFKYTFNNSSKINISFSVPSFNIYDMPPGVDIIDYIPNIETDCEYIDGDIIIFPGVPCALPEIAMCKKKLTKKILGKRINLGTIEYPCGIKQKTIGGIVLNKNDSSPDILFSFPGFKFKCQGNIVISGEMIIEITSDLPPDTFSDTLKSFDKDTYNSVTESGKKPITDSNAALRSIYLKKPDFVWLLNFAEWVKKNPLVTTKILDICITSIKISSTTSFKYFNASYGLESIFNINNLSYSENNYELLQGGRFISLSIGLSTAIQLKLMLGTYRIGQLFKDAAAAPEIADNFLGLISKMIISEKNTLQSGQRFRELSKALNYLNGLINSEYLNVTPFKIPNFVNMLKNVKNDVDLSLIFQVGLKNPPSCYMNAAVTFTFTQIFEFIKQYLADFIVDALLSSADAQLFLVNIEKEAIEFLIKPLKLPKSITSQIKQLNKKFDYARNLFKGYITIGIMESTSFLQKRINDELLNIPFRYPIKIPLFAYAV